MNEILRCIAERWSCRDFDGRPIEREKLDAIMKAAVQSPSAMNRQPWEFVAIIDKAMIEEMDKAAMDVLAAREDKSFYNRMMERGGSVFYNASAMIFVIKKKMANWDTFDCGIATQNIALAAHSLGKKVAFLHWPYSAASSMQSELYDLCCQTDMDIITSSDSVKADCLLIGYPPIAAHIPKSLPKIEADRVFVLVSEYAEYDPVWLRENLQKAFASEGTWVPVSSEIQRLMEDDARYPKPHPKPWHPLIDTRQCLSEPVRWRGSERPSPVISHGPANWAASGLNALSLRLFLQELDFLIYYPHQEYVEAFRRVAMEGMLAAKVVILPPCFQETFDDAAVYCETADVIPAAMRYWKNEQLYQEQAERGRDFVRRNCDWACLAERLAWEEDKAISAAPVFFGKANPWLIQPQGA